MLTMTTWCRGLRSHRPRYAIILIYSTLTFTLSKTFNATHQGYKTCVSWRRWTITTYSTLRLSFATTPSLFGPSLCGTFGATAMARISNSRCSTSITSFSYNSSTSITPNRRSNTFATWSMLKSTDCKRSFHKDERLINRCARSYCS